MLETAQSELTLFQDITQFSKSAAGDDLRKLLDGFVAESHDALVNCVSGSGEVYRTFTLRYQQTLLLKRAVDSWIESAVKGLEEITEEMRADLERMAAQGGE